MSSPVSMLEEARAIARQAIMTRIFHWVSIHQPPIDFEKLSDLEKDKAILDWVVKHQPPLDFDKLSRLEKDKAIARQAVMTRILIWGTKHHQPPTHFDHLSGVEKARAMARQAFVDRLYEWIAPKKRSGEGYNSQSDDGDLPHAYEVVDASHITVYLLGNPISLGV